MTRAGSPRYFDVAPTDRAMAALYEGSCFAPQLEFEFDTVLDDERLQRGSMPCCVIRFWVPPWTSPGRARSGVPTRRCRVRPCCRRRRARLAGRADLPTLHLRDESRSRLQLGIHHGVADGRSLVILIEDLPLSVPRADRRPAARRRHRLGPTAPSTVSCSMSVGPGSPTASGWGVVDAGVGGGAELATVDPSQRRRPIVISAHSEPARGSSVRFERAQLEAIQTAGATRWVASEPRAVGDPRSRWATIVVGTLARPRRRSAAPWAGDRRRPSTVPHDGVVWANWSGMAPVSIVGLESMSVPDTVDAVGRAFVEPCPTRHGIGRRPRVAGVRARWAGVPRGPPVRDTVGAWDAAYRYTRFFSHLDPIADSLADWGGAEMLGVRWCQSPPAAPHVAMMLVTFRGTTTLTIVVSPAALAVERVRALQVRGGLAPPRAR